MFVSALKSVAFRGYANVTSSALSSAVAPVKHFVLNYSFVENVVERRQPHRAAHLQVCKDFEKKGLVLGGAFNPAEGGMLVFRTEDKATVEEFVRKDPYVSQGLVTRSDIREWNVVVGESAHN